jgi:phage gp29-like protein
MDRKPVLTDRYGRPLKRSELRKQVAAPTFGGVRSPISGYPADGLNPVRLAQILREADQGDPIRYLELAETIEERDPHYLGVLGTRKRCVSQIEISVEAGSDDAKGTEMADMVRTWLTRDELSTELFDLLDSIGKGYSFTEIIWDTSMGQWQPDRLEWRDPRWFRFARHDLATPMMLGEHGQEETLPAFKFIHAQIKAKSGLALRSGLARVAAWGWMFKAFTQRDWAIFTQTYGQPLRVGKFGPGASEKDRDTLFDAVANIAGDCAAIIPEAMNIDFVESKTIGSSSDLYEKRSDWLDRQISKAVLGQTGTTDAVTGGLGSNKEHREVQEDIERADARALAGILNRDLIRPWIDLEYGPQKSYPRLKIERPEHEDLAALSSALGTLVPIGLKVKSKQVLDKFGLEEPGQDDEILGQNTQNPSETAIQAETTSPNSILYRVGSKIKRGQAAKRGTAALNLQSPSAGVLEPPSQEVVLADRLQDEAAPALEDMLLSVEAMLEAAGSLPEFREMLLAAYPDLDDTDLVEVMASALTAAHAGGRAALEADSG